MGISWATAATGIRTITKRKASECIFMTGSRDDLRMVSRLVEISPPAELRGDELEDAVNGVRFVVHTQAGRQAFLDRVASARATVTATSFEMPG
jgi:hypothetical protein